MSWFRVYIMTLLAFVSVATLAQNKTIALRDVYQSGIFYPNQNIELQFSKDGKSYYSIEHNSLYRSSLFDDDDKEMLLSSNILITDEGDLLNLRHIRFSKSEEKLFIFHREKKIYRWSFESIVYIYDIATKKLSRLSREAVMYPSFSPDDSKVAYVFNRDIWVCDLAQQTHQKITYGGKAGIQMNGMTDWVYEEEFEFTKAYEWTLDNQHIAYISMNEKNVKKYLLSYRVNGENYPNIYAYKYPKAGEQNSVISLNIVDINNHSNQTLSVFVDDKNQTDPDIYIPRLYITPSDDICVMRLNRLQNKMELLLYTNGRSQPTIIYSETDKYYVDISNFFIHFLSDGKQFVVSSERDGYNQLYLCNIMGGEPKKISKRNYDIDQVVGFNEAETIFYYTLAYPTALDRNIYSSNLNGKTKPITRTEGWHEAVFNPKAEFYLHTYSALARTPAVDLINTKTKKSKQLVNNSVLEENLELYGYVAPELVRIANRHGTLLNTHILKPKNMDINKRYPVLFYNYGGPGSQQVINRFGASKMWSQMMAQKGYIIVTCDNTGTGFRGSEFKKKTYLQLGKLEIEDQIDIAKYVARQKYVDTNRIGHIGWSYGGFLSSLAITKGAEIFSAAVAIAPVTNWKYYDNIYTERFMRKPIDNKQGYEDNSPINFVSQMKGKFLIIHGSADDNVHIQNTYAMIEEMVQQDVIFDMYIYPDKNHRIFGGNTYYHLWRNVTNWLLDNL